MGDFIIHIKRLLKTKWKQANINKANMDTVQETSAKSQVPGSRIENGRIFTEQENVQYILPKDIQELDRLHQQHWMIKIAFQGNFEAPIEEDLKRGIIVLDSGCGPGTWTCEMAETFPNSKFHGMDVVPVFPEQIKPTNCEFQLGNLNEKLPYPDNYFDYIHQRLVFLGLTAEGWEKALAELIRVLKPGGWIELIESQVTPDNMGPQVESLAKLCHCILKSKGLVPNVAADLGSLLEKNGCEEINVTKVNIPLNHGGILGTLYWADVREVFASLKSVVEVADPETYGNGKFDDAMEAIATEVVKYETAGIWFATYGRKPLA